MTQNFIPMLFAYHITGLDINSFKPLIEALLLNGDLQQDAIAIAYPKKDPAAKDIYVVSTEPILQDSDEIRTMTGDEFHEICHQVGNTNEYETWGNKELFEAHGMV